MKRRLLTIIALALSIQSFASDHQPATYLVTEESWAPYWIVKGKEVGGILSEVMIELNARLPNEITPIQPLPVKRAKIAFLKGTIQLECCVNPAWRDSKEDSEVSLWSDTVINAQEILIFPKGKRFVFEALKDLKGKQLATILGYGYVGDEFFERYDVLKNTSLLKMVAANRVDGSIIDHLEYRYAISSYQELVGAADNIDLGPVINESELKIRVHRSRADLLAPLNQAITDMKMEGVIDRIVKKYQ